MGRLGRWVTTNTAKVSATAASTDRAAASRFTTGSPSRSTPSGMPPKQSGTRRSGNPNSGKRSSRAQPRPATRWLRRRHVAAPCGQRSRHDWQRCRPDSDTVRPHTVHACRAASRRGRQPSPIPCPADTSLGSGVSAAHIAVATPVEIGRFAVFHRRRQTVHCSPRVAFGATLQDVLRPGLAAGSTAAFVVAVFAVIAVGGHGRLIWSMKSAT